MKKREEERPAENEQTKTRDNNVWRAVECGVLVLVVVVVGIAGSVGSAGSRGDERMDESDLATDEPMDEPPDT